MIEYSCLALNGFEYTGMKNRISYKNCISRKMGVADAERPTVPTIRTYMF